MFVLMTLVLIPRRPVVKSVIHEGSKRPRCLSLRWGRSYFTNPIPIFSPAGIPSVPDSVVLHSMQRYSGSAVMVRPDMLEHLFNLPWDISESFRSDIIR